jgi:hypothetical protein
MLRQTSLGSLGLVVGGILTVVGFAAYFLDYATLNLAGFFYGIPVLLGGLALKASELKPVPFSRSSSSEVLKLRDTQATATQTQIRKDVTRYRYGQAAHLDIALDRLGLRPTDEERPELKGIREENVAGAYGLILEFDSPYIPLEVWQQKQEKLTSFFGPGVRIEVKQPSENQIDLAIITAMQNEASE